MDDLPNFKAWSLTNLADFCTQAYKRLQEQALELEEERLNVKALMENYRKLVKEIYDARR